MLHISLQIQWHIHITQSPAFPPHQFEDWIGPKWNTCPQEKSWNGKKISKFCQPVNKFSCNIQKGVIWKKRQKWFPFWSFIKHADEMSIKVFMEVIHQWTLTSKPFHLPWQVVWYQNLKLFESATAVPIFPTFLRSYVTLFQKELSVFGFNFHAYRSTLWHWCEWNSTIIKNVPETSIKIFWDEDFHDATRWVITGKLRWKLAANWQNKTRRLLYTWKNNKTSKLRA